MLEYLLQLWPTSLTTQALVVGVVVGVSAYLMLKKRYKMPPGPRGWPIIGNVMEFSKDNMFKVIHKWSLDHGPVFKVKFGMANVVILNRIDVVLEALVKKQADFAGRPYLYSTNAFSDGGNDILMATYGPRWKLHRKLVSKAIRQYLSASNLDKKLSQSLSITTGLMRNQTGPFDPYPFISLAVFNIIYGMCFNKQSPDIDDKMFNFCIDGLTNFYKEFGKGIWEDVFPPLRLFPTRKFRNCKKIITTLNDSIGQEVAEHREAFNPSCPRDFTDALLLAQKEAEEEEDPELLSQITNTNIIQTISNVFFAGIDTSRMTLHWALLAMALHPDIQKKVQDEVDSVIGPDLNVHLSDRDKLPYTEAFLHETMRMRSVAPFGVPHATMCDTTVGGYEIPKDTMVMISHY